MELKDILINKLERMVSDLPEIAQTSKLHEGYQIACTQILDFIKGYK